MRINPGKNGQLALNMAASLGNLAVNIVIGFFLTPYLVHSIGGEAFGFIGLANDVIGYMAIATIALNSVAGRFITVSTHQNKSQTAITYFSSVFFANLAIALALTPIILAAIYRVEFFIEVPIALRQDVKILFAIIYANFALSLLGTVYTVSTFITNQLYISNIITTLSSIAKLASFTLLFALFSPNIILVGIGTLISGALTLFANIYCTAKLAPNFKIKWDLFSFRVVKEIIASGSWNVVVRVGQVMSDGLDLLLTNLFVGTYAMGQFAIAKSISFVLSIYLSSIMNVFGPRLTMLYAKNDTAGLVNEIKHSMTISSFFSNIPFCFIVIFGDLFYSLWVPNQNTPMIQALTILSVQAVAVSGATTVLYNVFLVTNQLRTPSIFWFGVSLVNVGIVGTLLKFTSFGVYVIAGVSTTTGIIALLTFVPMYACKCLKIKLSTFYPYIFRYIFVTFLMAMTLLLIRYTVPYQDNWLWLSIFGITTILVGVFVNFSLLFGSQEKITFLRFAKDKLHIKQDPVCKK